MSRGSPTFTDSSRAISLALALSVCGAERLGGVEVAIGSVRNHCLTGLKTELDAIELNRDDVWLERHQVGYAADLRIGVAIRPCRQTRITDVVVTAQTFIRAKGLIFHGRQRSLIDGGAWNVPARREAGFIKDKRPLRIGDDAITVADHKATGCLAYVDAVVAVGGMAHD